MTFAERLLDALSPVALDSDDLETYIDAQGDVLFQEIEDYASDGDNGEVGWSILVDLDRIPDAGLDYLAQFKGVQIPPGLTPAEKRERIQKTDGWNRGSAGAIAAAPLPYLTGTKTVIMRERDIDASPTLAAYGLTVITKFAETPDSASVLKALMDQKPAGILLNYEVLQGQDYQLLFQHYATYQAVFTTYANYDELLNDDPGGGGGGTTTKSGSDSGTSTETASVRVFVSSSDTNSTTTESANAGGLGSGAYGSGAYGSGQYGH